MSNAERIFAVLQCLHWPEEYDGMGLALASRIVERHGGRIWALSEPDGGATFRFTVASRGQARATSIGATRPRA